MLNSKKLLLLIFVFATIRISAQEIDFDNLFFGIVLEYSAPTGDFGKYWNNAQGIGGIINYKLTESFHFEMMLSASYFTPVNNENKYPKIILLNFPAGFKYSLISSNFMTNFTAGISNTTLAFRGKAAEIVEENDIESEFGVFGSLGLETNIDNLFNIEAYSRIQNIFTSPENIILYNFGIKILFDR